MSGNKPFDESTVRSLLDQLLQDSRLYVHSKDYKELLDFAVRFRNFAPFNAMLLQVQKPGLTFATSAHEWRERFQRRPKVGARPLIILWPFSPVALVYDILDTEGAPLPENVSAFLAQGVISSDKFASFKRLLKKKRIVWTALSAGDANAGLVRVVRRPADPKKPVEYCIHINEGHTLEVQFSTLAHELGHLFLGHLGRDRVRQIPDRTKLTGIQKEIEAESVAYLVCSRNEVTPKSQTYLSKLVTQDTTIDNLDVYQVMRAAGQVEAILGLTISIKHGSDTRVPKRKKSKARESTKQAAKEALKGLW